MSGGVNLLVWTLALTVAWTAQVDDANDDDNGLDPTASVPGDLLDREPFFQLTLDAENDHAVLEILPLERVPAAPKPTDRLRVRLVRQPDQEYEVLWQHIARVRTYQQLVFDEAVRLTQAKDYNAAFRYFDYVLKHSTPTPALGITILEYLLASAEQLLAEQHIDQALAVLDEVLQRDPDFRRAEVNQRLAQAADQLIRQEVEQGNFAQARARMQRLQSRYGADRIAALAQWQRRLIEKATALQHDVEAFVAAAQWRQAEQLSRWMMAVWPDLPGAAALRETVVRNYPMVIVAVSEVAARQDLTSLDNWPARRTGRLTQRALLEFRGAGPEGGQYFCPFGEYSQSDDRRRLTIALHPPTSPDLGGLDGYALERQLQEMANPAAADYQPTWAALAAGFRVEDVFTLQIDLRRPHVLPEALLQVPLKLQTPPEAGPIPGEGAYRWQASEDGDVHFLANPRYPFAEHDHPREIVERYFATSDQAVAALRRGDVDAIDYLLPDAAARLRGDPQVRVSTYALPTIHLLVPNPDGLFTGNARFRRALLYGINRQSILDTEILGNQKLPGYAVISGPFPIGTRDNDPLAYAYDPTVLPAPYEPRLAIILATLARRELQETAAKRGTTLPADTHLVLGHPPQELARITCQAIAQYLQAVGITCALRELPPDAPPGAARDVDLLYVQAAMWEPVIDARRLLAPQESESVNEYVGMALRRLDAARNWREVRARLHELHRIVAEQVAIIPLWQTVNHCVYGEQLMGGNIRPLTLYEDVAQWQVVRPRQ